MNLERGPIVPSRVWRGLGASPGRVAGTARVLRSERDIDATPGRTAGRPDEVLIVRHATTPMFSQLVHAAAAVSETGGLCSHLAILARELGKPCVTGVRGIVEAIPPAARVRLDGTTGVVQLLAAAPFEGFPDAPEPGAASAMMPMLQFGTFSSAFQPQRVVFDAKAAIRTAALIGLPEHIGTGPRWRFTIDRNQVLVDRNQFERTAHRLVARLLSGALDATELRREYLDISGWDGWTALAGRPDDGMLLAALRRYLRLNQLTWTAVMAKEPLTRHYECFLAARLPQLAAPDRHRLLLRSLSMPNRSYLPTAFASRGDRDVWSGVAAGHAVEQRRATLGKARALADESSAKRLEAVHELRRRFRAEDFAVAARHLSILDHLLELAEQKNTTLNARERRLFGRPGHAERIARLAGFGGEVASRAEAVTAVLEWSSRDGLDRQMGARR
jgi:phosphohistidine swiveling domain-containing protein